MCTSSREKIDVLDSLASRGLSARPRHVCAHCLRQVGVLLLQLPLLSELGLGGRRGFRRLALGVEGARDDVVRREAEAAVDAHKVMEDLEEKVADQDRHRHGQRPVELHPAIQQRREHEADQPRRKAHQRELVVRHHPVHRGRHRAVGAAQREARAEDGAQRGVDDSQQLEAHDEGGDDEVGRLSQRIRLLVERHLGQAVPGKARKERRRGRDGEAVVGVVHELLLANAQHLHLELRPQRILVGVQHERAQQEVGTQGER
mmetsp:Transcript_13041/g.42209  ORF Transcript_13041/g.42209 Transcript_13041/m.42209 type:complete len:260 (-) Transcript_13041:37-816(-)